jgi:hypothetical protein
LAQEIASLNNSLSLSENGSIFVRTSEERLDVMKVCLYCLSRGFRGEERRI